MTKKRFFVTVLAVVMIAVLPAGCGNSNVENLADEAGVFAADEEGKSFTDKLALAWSPCNLSDEYYQKATSGFEDYCTEKKYNALVADPKNNREEQYSEFENWIAMGVDGIAASPIDSLRLEEVVRAAQDEGIVVAGFYKEIPQANVNFVMDEFAYGELLGQNAKRWIDEKITGSARVFILGNNNDEGFSQRQEGIESVLSDIKALRVVSRKNETTAVEARKTAYDVLDTYKTINVVICVDDAYALEVLEAVKDLNIETENFYIGGGGYTSDAIQKMNIAGSYFRSTVMLDPYQAGRQMARMMAEAVVKGSYGRRVYMDFESYWQNLLRWE
jgi:ribose transport system substrate-binding protein